MMKGRPGEITEFEIIEITAWQIRMCIWGPGNVKMQTLRKSKRGLRFSLLTSSRVLPMLVVHRSYFKQQEQRWQLNSGTWDRSRSLDTCFFPLYHASSGCCKLSSVLVPLTRSQPETKSGFSSPTFVYKDRHSNKSESQLSDETKTRRKKPQSTYTTEKVRSVLSEETCGSPINKFLEKTKELYSKENPKGMKYSVNIS